MIEPFDYHGVRLGEGAVRAQLDRVREFYLGIPNDDLLMGFRARTGKEAPGMDLGGWYSQDIFHIFGQVISGLSRMYSLTRDEACLEKVALLTFLWASGMGDLLQR